MTTILCDAVPFCFGPVSKMISIAEHLRQPGVKLQLLASGTSLELGSKSGLFEIKHCNSESTVDLKKRQKSFEGADAFITVMNPEAAKFSLKLGIPTIYVDSLFWMWDVIPKQLYGADRYFIQNFSDSKAVLRKHSGLRNAEIVGPIIDDSLGIEKKKEDYLLVNFGGMESSLIQVGKNSRYPFVVGKIVAQALAETKQKAYFCGNNKIVRKAISRNPRSRWVGGKSHKAFLEILRKAKGMLTIPGLTSTFEAFYYEVPLVFLPPENYSQFLNLHILRNGGTAPRAFHWSDVYPNLNVRPHENEKEGVRKVLRCIKKFEADKVAQKKFKDYLVESLEGDKVRTVLRQKNYLNSLGKNSAKKIADYVLEKARAG